MSNDLKNHFFKNFDLPTLFVTQGKKEGEIKLIPFNLDR